MSKFKTKKFDKIANNPRKSCLRSSKFKKSEIRNLFLVEGIET